MNVSAPEGTASQGTASEDTASEDTASEGTAGGAEPAGLLAASALAVNAGSSSDGLSGSAGGRGSEGSGGSVGGVLRATAPSRPGLPTRLRVHIWGPPTIVLVIFIAIWYLFSYVILSERRRFLAPPPHEVIDASFLDGHNRSELLAGLVLSTQVAMLGLAIAIVLGMFAAVLMSQAKWLERSLFPYAVVLQTVPILALVPLLGLWFNYGFTARVIVCVLIALFPIISNTLFGLQSADAALHDLFTLNRAGRLTRLWKLQLPAAMPAVFAGFRISAGLSVIGSIVGDFFFKQGDRGLGILIEVYRSRVYTDRMYGAIILSSLLGIVVFWFFGLLSRFVVGRWYRPDRDTG